MLEANDDHDAKYAPRRGQNVPEGGNDERTQVHVDRPRSEPSPADQHIDNADHHGSTFDNRERVRPLTEKHDLHQRVHDNRALRQVL